MIISSHGESRRGHVAGLLGLAAATVVGTGAAVLLAGAPSASAATSGSACAAATSGAQVHYLVALGSTGPAISGVTISGFDQSACDGLPVTLVLSGNTAGDPAQPANELLSTLDSSLDQCTGAKLPGPVTISGGVITLHGCSSVTDPHAAAYVSIHDVTQLALSVAGASTPAQVGGITTQTTPPAPPTTGGTTPSSSGSQGVAGVHTQASGGGHGTSGQGGTHTGPLASTGVKVALLTAIGLLLLALGLFLLIAARRRRAGHAG